MNPIESAARRAVSIYAAYADYDDDARFLADLSKPLDDLCKHFGELLPIFEAGGMIRKVPAEPFRAHLNGNVADLAHQIAHRTGRKQPSVLRMLMRIKSGKQSHVDWITADRLAAGIGLPTSFVFPDYVAAEVPGG